MATIEDFFDTPSWGSDVEVEIRNRIKLSIAAYSYEFEDVSIMDDAQFDSLCKSIRPQLKTGNAKLDKFFKTKFDPSTGQWIHSHPEINQIKKLYKLYYEENHA